MKHITHFIYDMDGLLLDTEPFYTRVTQQVVGEYGKTFDWELKARMMGRPSIDSAKLLVNTLELPFSPEKYLELREEMLIKMLPDTESKPGAERLTGVVAARGISQAVGTSSASHIFELKIRNHKEWFASFDVIVTGDDPQIEKGKPAPDIFLLAAKRMNAEPECCLVFEDSLSGVEAGIAAGMSVVAVPDPNMDKEQFNNADRVLDSLEDFNFSDWVLS